MKKTLLMTLLVLISFGLITNCDLPDTELHIASGAFMTHVTQVEFTDDPTATSNRSITGIEGLEVMVTGPHAERVYNIEGEKGPGAFKIVGGILLLLLDPNIDFVGEEIYVVYVTIDANSYEKRTFPVTFSKDINDGYVQAVLLDKNNLPVEAVKETITKGTLDSSEGLSEEVKLVAGNSSVNEVTTEVTVPTGTIMKDNSGTVLTGELEAEVISFTDSGLGGAYFPGGKEHTNIDNGNGTSAAGTFETVGFVSVKMKVGGKSVTEFVGEKVGIEIYLKEGSINPSTGVPYVLGDAIHVWSYSDATGVWTYEDETVVSKDSNEKLFVSHETEHLSVFGAGYLRPYGGVTGFVPLGGATLGAAGPLALGLGAIVAVGTIPGGINCDDIMERTIVKLDWANLNNPDVVHCRFDFYSGTSDDSVFEYAYAKSILKEISFDLPKTLFKDGFVKVIDLDHGHQELGVFNFEKGSCFVNLISTSITVDNPIKTQVVLDFQGFCGSTKVFAPVGTRVLYKLKEESDDAYQNFHYVNTDNQYNSSIITDKVEAGKTYVFKVISGSKEPTQELAVEAGVNIIKIDIPDDICDILK